MKKHIVSYLCCICTKVGYYMIYNSVLIIFVFAYIVGNVSKATSIRVPYTSTKIGHDFPVVP